MHINRHLLCNIYVSKKRKRKKPQIYPTLVMARDKLDSNLFAAFWYKGRGE